MGTTVWIDTETRDALRELQHDIGASSVNATIRHLLARPAPNARAIFATHREAIRAILARHRLTDLVAFGSRARGDATPTSDLDLAARVTLGASPLAILAAEADLEEALGIPVGLVELPNEKLAPVIAREGVRFEG